jgi:DNA replication protein DnaC
MKRIGDVLKRQATPAPSRGAALPPQEPVCPICQGAGYLIPDVPVGHRLFGVPQRCECRSALESQQSIDDLLRMSNIDPFRDKSFANFDTKVKGVEKACKAARDFARDPQGWLVLKGPYGCGKTHLAAAIGNEAIGRHLQTLFSVVPDLLDHLRSTFGPSSETSYDDVFERVRGTNILILDDLGTESSTPWAREKLFQILNYRYNYRMPTVITTNRDLRQIDERIVSRMQDVDLSKFMEITAGDYRTNERGERRVRSGPRATGRTTT